MFLVSRVYCCWLTVCIVVGCPSVLLLLGYVLLVGRVELFLVGRVYCCWLALCIVFGFAVCNCCWLAVCIVVRRPRVIVVGWQCVFLLVSRLKLLLFCRVYCCCLGVCIVVGWPCGIVVGWPCVLLVGRVYLLLFGCV